MVMCYIITYNLYLGGAKNTGGAGNRIDPAILTQLHFSDDRMKVTMETVFTITLSSDMTARDNWVEPYHDAEIHPRKINNDDMVAHVRPNKIGNKEKSLPRTKPLRGGGGLKQNRSKICLSSS